MEGSYIRIIESVLFGISNPSNTSSSNFSNAFPPYLHMKMSQFGHSTTVEEAAKKFSDQINGKTGS